MVESAVDNAKINANDVQSVLVEVAKDKEHKEWLGATKEFHRVLEKRQRPEVGQVKLELEF
jgi:hypothetical protein